MNRLPLEEFESAARQLCIMRDRDPDELSYMRRPKPGGADEKKRPLWMNFAEQLRSHYECDLALERDGL